MIKKKLNNYFLILFSILPISIIVGSSASLINILIIDISFISMIVYNKNYSFLKSKVLKYLIFLYLYLIFNSLISVDHSVGFYRNFGFLRIIILFVAINYFFNQKFFYKKVLFFWSLIILFVVLDVFFESLTGRNILGYGGNFGGQGGSRIVSFFKDEPIVGGYISGFYLILIGYLFENFGKDKKNLILIISVICLICIFLTGERSNSIKAFTGLCFFYFFFSDFKIKHKITIFCLIGVTMFFLILNSQFLKLRFIDQMKYYIQSDNIYFQLYRSGFEVFKNNKLFGVGNKNYRVVTCDQANINLNGDNENYQCSTHPHQIYFELLSEHGVLGSFIILFILYKVVFSKIRKTIKSKNFIQLGSLIYILITFLPLIPSGAFFGDYLLTIFTINLSIFYSINSEFNIFKESSKREGKIF